MSTRQAMGGVERNVGLIRTPSTHQRTPHPRTRVQIAQRDIRMESSGRKACVHVVLPHISLEKVFNLLVVFNTSRNQRSSAAGCRRFSQVLRSTSTPPLSVASGFAFTAHSHSHGVTRCTVHWLWLAARRSPLTSRASHRAAAAWRGTGRPGLSAGTQAAARRRPPAAPPPPPPPPRDCPRPRVCPGPSAASGWPQPSPGTGPRRGRRGPGTARRGPAPLRPACASRARRRRGLSLLSRGRPWRQMRQ